MGGVSQILDEARRAARPGEPALTAEVLQAAFDAAIEPEAGQEPGRTVDRDEIAAFNGIRPGEIGAAAKTLFEQELAPRLAAMRSPEAIRAGVNARGPGVGAVASVLPRPARRNPEIVAAWAKMLGEAGGASSSHIVANNFEVDGRPQATYVWGGDNGDRSGSFPSPHCQSTCPATLRLTRVPADGVLDMTLLTFPSGHDGRRWHFARTNTYDIVITFPTGNVVTLGGVRNRPRGPADQVHVDGPLADGRGREETVTFQDLSLDLKPYKPGQVINISMYPRGTSAQGSYAHRSFDVVVPDLATTPKLAGSPGARQGW